MAENIAVRSQPSDKIFFMLCCSTIALLLIRDVGNVNIPKEVFIALAAVVFAISDLDHMAIFTCFLIPFLDGLPGSYMFGVGLLILIVKYWNQLEVSKYILVLFIIFTVELLSFYYGDFKLIDYVRLIAPLLLISLFIFSIEDKVNYEKMLIYLLFAAVGAELSVILQTISVDGLNNLVSSGLRLGNTEKLLSEEGMRVSFNPNSLGRLCAMSISFLLIMLYRRTPNKLVVTSLLIFQIVVGSMSLSRNFLITLIMIVVIYVLSSGNSFKRNFLSLGQLALITGAVYTAIKYYFPGLFASYLARFAVADISAGRIEITIAYFNVWFQHPEWLFLGVGIQNYSQKYGIPISSHNATQEVLVTWGVVGVVLVAVYFYGIYAHGWRGVPKNNRNIIYLLPLIVLLVGSQSGQFFSTGKLPLYLLPAYAAMRLAANHTSED